MFGFLFLLLFSFAHACHPQFEKELRYLDAYLGIRPSNDGELKTFEQQAYVNYVRSASSLDCDFESECLWMNAPSDGLLDTSDFWLFAKTDEKQFPVQIQPGSPAVRKGAKLLVAGNTTLPAQSALLLSAPIACHRGNANVTFNYWLYNHGRVEVVAIRPKPRRKRYMVIQRAQSDCHFLREGGHVCSAGLEQINEPYRLAIRAFNLRDDKVGSMVLLNDVRVRADLCQESPIPHIFGSIPLNPRPRAYPSALRDIECRHPLAGCRWSNAASAAAEWRIGKDADNFRELLEIPRSTAVPNSSFLFIAVDALTPRPFGVLKSQVIPCIAKTSTLAFRYWLKTGTQVEVCSVDEDDIPLSCAYLSEEDSPGPIQIDVEPYMRPFKFTIELINFDTNSIGLVAVDGLEFVSGMLCTEHPPPAATTIDPPTISHMFGLQPRPYGSANNYRLSLDCDFSVDHCGQWVNDDGKLLYGVIPGGMEDFPLPESVEGNVAVLLLKGKDASSIRSREIPCAYHALITIHYMRSEFGFLRVCALGQCLEGKKRDGTLQVAVSSESAFEIIIEASSSRNAMIVISEIEVEGDVCPLRTVEQILCSRIKCDFKDDLCEYASPAEGAADRELALAINGAACSLPGANATRCILRSPYFDLPSPVLLKMEVTQFTFGSRVLLCADADVEASSCSELLGPRVLSASPRTIQFPLDESVHQFSLVLFHDKAAQFGAARFEVGYVDVVTAEGFQLCF